MKKFLIYISIIIICIFPLNVLAAAITKTSISGNDSVTVGDTFSLSFSVDYSGVQKGTSDSLGVAGVVFQVDFDDSIFSVVGVSNTSEFETSVIKNNGKYYVVSAITDSNQSRNKCVDEVLYCANYITTLKFYVKDTSSNNSTIKMNDINVVLFKVDSDYENDETITLQNGQAHNITINKASGEVASEPNSIATPGSTNVVATVEKKASVATKEKSVNNDNNQDKNTEKTTNKGDMNNYLSKIEIKDYNINFDKEKLEYTIHIKNDVNKLDISATTESDKAKYTVLGAEDLKKSNYKVNIEVIAENGSKKVYIINVVKDKNRAWKRTTSEKNKNIKLGKKTIIGISSILVGIIIIIIVIVRKNKKLDKMFDNL